MSDDFPIHKGTLLASRYEVQAFLGEGSFGKVAKCLDTVTNTKVAIKITKDKKVFTQQAEEEIKILEDLRHLDPDKCNLVRWNGSFLHERFMCLEFELLDMSLLEYVEQTPQQSLSLAEIRPILHQLLTALLHLEGLTIMHGDLKPENIMVVNRRQRPLQVKLIDFGLARYAADVVPGSRAQSLWYRAPEVMLGLAFSEPVDMWSLGLVAVELAIGCPLFPGNNEYDMMKFITETLEQPPDYQLNCGQHSTQFFHIDDSCDQPTWRLKSPSQYARETGHVFSDTRYFIFNSLDGLLQMMYFNKMGEMDELRVFVDLLKKMLQVDKHARIIPHKALEHPFFAVGQHTDSSHTTNIENLTADPKEAEPTISQQSVSQQKRDHSLELCNVPPKAMTPHDETVCTQPESVSAKLVDEEDGATLKQTEFLVETSSESVGCFKMLFEGIRNVFSSCFYSCD